MDDQNRVSEPSVGQAEHLVEREFRVFGWEKILREIPAGDFKDEVTEAIANQKPTTGIRIELTNDEATFVDNTAAQLNIDPHSIPDMGQKIRGKGKPYHEKN